MRKCVRQIGSFRGGGSLSNRRVRHSPCADPTADREEVHVITVQGLRYRGKPDTVGQCHGEKTQDSGGGIWPGTEDTTLRKHS